MTLFEDLAKAMQINPHILAYASLYSYAQTIDFLNRSGHLRQLLLKFFLGLLRFLGWTFAGPVARSYISVASPVRELVSTAYFRAT